MKEITGVRKKGPAGIMGSLFPDCGIFGLFQQIVGTESRGQVITFFAALRKANPPLRLIGYDDWCHIVESLRIADVASLADVEGFIDRWHLRKGHSRDTCHMLYSPDTQVQMWEYYENVISNEEDLRSLLKLLKSLKKLNGLEHLHRLKGELD